MESASAANLVRLLLQQSDRHPIRAVSAADLEIYDRRIVRSLRKMGVLVQREDLVDDGLTGFHDDGELIAVDFDTGACERNEDATGIRLFDIGMGAVCRALREQSNLIGPGPEAITSRLWRLGRHVEQMRTAEVCLVRQLRAQTAQEIIDHVRGAIDAETSIILVSLGRCDLPTSVDRQLGLLRMSVRYVGDLLRDDPARPFSLDLGRMVIPAVSSAPEARLVFDRVGRRVVFDGFELKVEPRDFAPFLLLAEEAKAVGGWISSESLRAALEGSTGRDSNPEQADRIVNRLRDVFRRDGRLSAVPDNGFIERKPKVGARLTFVPSEIGFIA